MALDSTAGDASSVGTQSLIANEFIPDALPSTEVSNATMLDLGSIATVESLGIGLFASSTSKNLDFSIYNLISPGLFPSGELTSREDLVASSSSGPGPSPSPHSRPAEGQNQASSPAPAMATNGRGKERAGKRGAKKAAEVNWESIDRVRLFDDEYSTHRPAKLVGHAAADDGHGNTLHVLPQEVQVVEIFEPTAGNRSESRCTHYTHSTAPLAGGANMLGSQVHPSTVLRQSVISSEPSLNSSVTFRKFSKLEFWPSEVALTYTFCMASIAMYGRTSLIRKTALEGPGKAGQEAGWTARAGKGGRSGLRNYGLLELARFGDDRDIEGR